MTPRSPAEAQPPATLMVLATTGSPPVQEPAKAAGSDPGLSRMFYVHFRYEMEGSNMVSMMFNIEDLGKETISFLSKIDRCSCG